jgi:hypothetical protein
MWPLKSVAPYVNYVKTPIVNYVVKNHQSSGKKFSRHNNFSNRPAFCTAHVKRIGSGRIISKK